MINNINKAMGKCTENNCKIKTSNRQKVIIFADSIENMSDCK